MKKKNSKIWAFTLAEVLITLGIIGVVAALTIPTLVANYQAKSWNTAASVFDKRLTEAIKTMNVQSKLGSYGGYSTTEGFVAELQKHLKIAKVCDNDHLMQCFEDTVTINNEEVDMTKVKTSENLGQKDWGTNIVGLQIANGTSALIAYNPKCKSNPYDNTITGSDCFAIVYDTSGYSSPNELNKDLRQNASVLKIAGKSCVFEIGGTCYTQPKGEITPLSRAECESGNLGITRCFDNDYWGGAVKACGGLDKMPTAADLAKIASEIYGSTVSAEGSLSASWNKAKAEELGFNTSITAGGGFTIWEGAEASNRFCSLDVTSCPAYTREFSPNFTGRRNTVYRWGASHIVTICIGE